VVSGADYHHTEQLLKKNERVYSEAYWNKRVFAPSALLFFLGISHKLKNLEHHTLFFDEEFDPHAASIYDQPAWPEKPLFYASCSSISDDSTAPSGMENLTLLIPLAPGIEDSEAIREKYYRLIIERLERITGNRIQDDVLVKKSYCLNDFIEDYHSYKGNAYGLANTLMQTSFLRPRIKSSKVRNLFFTGQLTVPGPGVPPSLISGKIAAEQITAS
jgi:phytoene desaturase